VFSSILQMSTQFSLLVVITTASTVQATCSSVYSHYGHVLKNHVLTSFTAGDPSDCYAKCKTVQGCQSMNYYFTSSKCELNSKMSTKFKEDYRQQDSVMYMSIIDIGKEWIEI